MTKIGYTPQSNYYTQSSKNTQTKLSISGNIGARYEQFCKDNALLGRALITLDKISSAYIEKLAADTGVGKADGNLTEEEYDKATDLYYKTQFDVTGQEYRDLANQKDKTPEEFKRMEQLYREGFTNFGESYLNHIDSEYGNGDGTLTKEEYIQSETENTPEMKTEAENSFNHIDLNKDSKLDKKELGAMFSMFDMDVTNGNINGKIKIYDQEANTLNMIKPSSSNSGAAMDRKIQGMYNFLYGKTE